MPRITSNSSRITIHLESPNQSHHGILLTSTKNTDHIITGPPIFRPGNLIRGYVDVETTKSYGLKHHGVVIELRGETLLNVDASVVGLLDAFALGDPQGVVWVSRKVELDCPQPSFPQGITRLAFELPLATDSNRQIYESQRGIQINTTYKIHATLNRPGLSLTEMGTKILSDEIEILVEAPLTSIPPSVPPTKFRMNPLTSTLLVEPLPSKAFLTTSPDFELIGMVDTRCDLSNSLVRGHIQIERSTCAIEQIEVQVIRVETVPWTHDETIYEEAEIVKCQIIDGNIPVDLPVPFQILLPRLLSAPSVHLTEFSLAFELNFLLELVDGSIWKGTLDLILYRTELPGVENNNTSKLNNNNNTVVTTLVSKNEEIVI
jgi:hypothetical protein